MMQKNLPKSGAYVSQFHQFDEVRDKMGTFDLTKEIQDEHDANRPGGVDSSQMHTIFKQPQSTSDEMNTLANLSLNESEIKEFNSLNMQLQNDKSKGLREYCKEAMTKVFGIRQEDIAKIDIKNKNAKMNKNKQKVGENMQNSVLKYDCNIKTLSEKY